MKIVIEGGTGRAIVKEDDVHGAFQDIGGGIVAAQGYGTPQFTRALNRRIRRRLERPTKPRRRS